jgi:hypothetical protein
MTLRLGRSRKWYPVAIVLNHPVYRRRGNKLFCGQTENNFETDCAAIAGFDPSAVGLYPCCYCFGFGSRHLKNTLGDSTPVLGLFRTGAGHTTAPNTACSTVRWNAERKPLSVRRLNWNHDRIEESV